MRCSAVLLLCASSLVAPCLADDLSQAETFLRQGRAREAAQTFEAILARTPDDERAIGGRIEAWIDADRWTEALEEARRLGERGRSRADLASAVGAALYRAGLLEEASELLTPHAAANELTARGWTVLGSIRLAEGRSGEALEMMARALAADPEDARVVLRAAEAATTRAESAARLARYLEIGGGDDADRLEGARGTLRWLKALGERSVWRARAAPERLVLPLAPVAGGGWTVAVRLGPKRRVARLLFDTGSGGVFLVDRVARRGEVEELAQETAFGGGGEGRHRSTRGLLRSFALASLEFEDALVETTTVEIDPSGRYQGVLGPGVLDGYRLLVDLRGGTLTLEREGTNASGADGVPYWNVSGQLLVRAAARGAPEGLFLLDTGATQSVLDLDYAARIPGARLEASAAARGYGGAIAGARRVDRAQLTLLGHDTGGRPLVATDLGARSRLGGVEIAGYVGMDLLAGTVLVIDPFTRRVDLRAVR
jgi:Tfp pilus assembly protein PilF